jgi:hypothetical protein
MYTVRIVGVVSVIGPGLLTQHVNKLDWIIVIIIISISIIIVIII